MLKLSCLASLIIAFQAANANYADPSPDVANKRVLLEDNYYTIMHRLDQLTAEVAELKKNQGISSKQRVAFKAHLAKAFTPTPDQLIVFDDVRFNEGNAYRHGTFIAPYNGTYLFAVTMCSQSGHYIIVDLLRNGNMIGQVLAGDDAYGDCASETTVAELAAGDDVIVQHRGNNGDYIYGDSNLHSSFTGVFLY